MEADYVRCNMNIMIKNTLILEKLIMLDCLLYWNLIFQVIIEY